jgi:hypothetical protein
MHNSPSLVNEESNSDVFSGEYSIGEGGTHIYPVNGTYEMRNEKGETQHVLFFQRKEKDTVSVYGTKNKTITIKMNPGHKTGRYFENDESWPVTFVKPNPKEETEKEETERILKQRHQDDSVAFSELAIYNGTYRIQTESDGVNATLKLQYKGNQTFAYDWSFNVSAEEADCNAKRKGILTMDRTQHGFDRKGNCMMHFNFNGLWEKGYVVEIDFEDASQCPDLKGSCTFSGTYVTEK